MAGDPSTGGTDRTEDPRRDEAGGPERIVGGGPTPAPDPSGSGEDQAATGGVEDLGPAESGASDPVGPGEGETGTVGVHDPDLEETDVPDPAGVADPDTADAEAVDPTGVDAPEPGEDVESLLGTGQDTVSLTVTADADPDETDPEGADPQERGTDDGRGPGEVAPVDGAQEIAARLEAWPRIPGEAGTLITLRTERPRGGADQGEPQGPEGAAEPQEPDEPDEEDRPARERQAIWSEPDFGTVRGPAPDREEAAGESPDEEEVPVGRLFRQESARIVFPTAWAAGLIVFEVLIVAVSRSGHLCAQEADASALWNTAVALPVVLAVLAGVSTRLRRAWDGELIPPGAVGAIMAFAGTLVALAALASVYGLVVLGRWDLCTGRTGAVEFTGTILPGLVTLLALGPFHRWTRAVRSPWAAAGLTALATALACALTAAGWVAASLWSVGAGG